MKRLFLNFAMPLLLFTSLHGQLTINVKIPPTTPDGDVYIAGNFNGWNPNSAAYNLVKKDALLYSINFKPGKGSLEFKFTRGSWSSPEGTVQGGYIPNRSFVYDGKADTLNLEVKGWEDVKAAASTASKNVYIADDSFYMKALKRYRKVWIYLPPDYNASTKSYPVLYMHDGQNLFDKKTSFAGEWQVDETLDRMYAQGKAVAIVVGIDNGGGDRINEYSPWVNATYGGGNGDAYVSFIVDELKP
jgi:Putative esterase